MTVRETIIENAYKVDPSRTMKENAAALGVNYNTYRREMPKLEKQGVFTRVHRGRYIVSGAVPPTAHSKTIQEEIEEVKDKDYNEMKTYMGAWNKNYTLVSKERWHTLWEAWRTAQDQEDEESFL